MRKTLIDSAAPAASQTSAGHENSWLDLDQIATVEITSEDPLFPIDHALGSTPTAGWRSAAKGPQLIRLNFDKPTAIRRIHLQFTDLAAERSQEFAIYAGSDGGSEKGSDKGKDKGEMREVIRQQFIFSPGGSSEEVEDYTVDLPAVTTLELRIDPDRAHDPAHSKHYAVLKSLRIA